MVLDSRGRAEPTLIEIGASGSFSSRRDRVYESARTKVDERQLEEMLLAAIGSEECSLLSVRKL